MFTRTHRAHYLFASSLFGILGFHVGVWAVQLAPLAAGLRLGPAKLGAAVTVAAAAGLSGRCGTYPEDATGRLDPDGGADVSVPGGHGRSPPARRLASRTCWTPMMVAAPLISPLAIRPGSSARGIQRTASVSFGSVLPARSAPRARYSS